MYIVVFIVWLMFKTGFENDSIYFAFIIEYC